MSTNMNGTCVPGAGKTFTLEGPRAKDSGRVSSDGDGVVHHAIDELFRILNQKAVAVGEDGAWPPGVGPLGAFVREPAQHSTPNYLLALLL